MIALQGAKNAAAARTLIASRVLTAYPHRKPGMSPWPVICPQYSLVPSSQHTTSYGRLVRVNRPVDGAYEEVIIELK